jgi:hypothetical protein
MLHQRPSDRAGLRGAGGDERADVDLGFTGWLIDVAGCFVAQHDGTEQLLAGVSHPHGSAVSSSADQCDDLGPSGKWRGAPLVGSAARSKPRDGFVIESNNGVGVVAGGDAQLHA